MMKTRPTLRRLTVLVLFVVFAFPASVPLLPLANAQAQERRTILDMVFGRPRQQERVYETYGDGGRAYEEPRATAPAQPKPARRNRPKPAAAQAPAKAVIDKLPDAKKVLVVGDFIAGSLSEGLRQAFSETPGIVVEDRNEGSSGLVRDDYFDWPDMLPVLTDDVKPAVIVVSLGANDRQQMKIGSAREKYGTSAWMTEYTRRVADFAALARSRKVSLLWIGMPSFPSQSMTADMVTLNGLFRAETEKAGGQFIDIWDGFVDESGKFVTTGSDINGQQVRLRGADGITLTAAGKRKLAFYAEKDIRRLLGETAVPDGDIPDPTGMKDLVVMPPTTDAIVRTRPISLTDPDLDGASSLLDASTLGNGNGRSPRDLLIEKGQIAEAPTGRVDDYRVEKRQSNQAGSDGKVVPPT